MNFRQICLCLLLSELSGTIQYPYLGVGECYTKNQLKTGLNFEVILHIRLLSQILSQFHTSVFFLVFNLFFVEVAKFG
jgi:hypothetical protein